MRSIWSGSISFGLVNIPVKLYSAQATAHEIDFDMLHVKDLSPIRYARICKKEDKEVPFSEIIKGVDVGAGRYVTMSSEEFERVLPRKNKSIEIVSFCNLGEVDPIYYVKPYYLESDKQSDKPYRLLESSLSKTGKVGIAKYVLRSKEHLVMLRPYQGILMLIQLRFYDEIADLSKIRFPAASSVSKQEQKLATELISQITGPFDPTRFRDTYTEEVRSIIKSKMEGEKLMPKEEEPTPTEVNNLIEALANSLRKDE